MKTSKTGVVYFVGAGPGDPGLITRKGSELLQKCDIVIYDALVSAELLTILPQRIERIYVGKRAGAHSQAQASINELLVTNAKKGKTVVRLKGGDPTIFARLCEEIDACFENEIPFIIIPGVTASSGAAATNRFSLTERASVSWVVQATGHEADSDSPSVPWKELGGLEGKLLAIYMGVGQFERIVNELLSGGMDPRTSCLVVQNATTGLERSVYGTLQNIIERSKEENISPPALIMIGKNTHKRTTNEKFQPAKLPLQGKRILITRPAEYHAETCGKFRELGADTLPYPTISISGEEDNDNWKEFMSMARTGGWCVFTSEAGVNYFFDKLFKNEYDVRIMGNFKIAAVGHGTSRALQKKGIFPDLIPANALVGELAETLAGNYDLQGVNLVRICGNKSDNIIQRKAEAKGANVLSLKVYRNDFAEWEPHWLRELLNNPPDFCVYTSGSTFEGMMKCIGSQNAESFFSESKIVTIGPMTSKIVRKYGFVTQVEALKHSIDGIIEALVKETKKSY